MASPSLYFSVTFKMFMFKRIPEFLGTTRILALGVIIFGVCSVYSLTDSRDLLLTLSEKNALKKVCHEFLHLKILLYFVKRFCHNFVF